MENEHDEGCYEHNIDKDLNECICNKDKIQDKRLFEEFKLKVKGLYDEVNTLLIHYEDYERNEEIDNQLAEARDNLYSVLEVIKELE